MSATRILLALFFALAVFAPKHAVAQTMYVRDYYRGYPRITYPTTARESYSYGRAALIRARGEYNLATSQAWISQQEAYSRYLDNRGKATRTYFDMRSMNRAYREVERRPRPTQAQLERMAKRGVPEPLSPSELDSIAGAITWPMVLTDPKFNRNRQQIESFFSERAQPSFELSIGASQDVLNAIGEMRTKLKSQIRDMDLGEYIAARRFLESLAYEVRQ